MAQLQHGYQFPLLRCQIPLCVPAPYSMTVVPPSLCDIYSSVLEASSSLPDNKLSSKSHCSVVCSVVG